ncbi:MAG: hypothetical protein ACK5ME_10270 [Parahaliea sp.]
MKPLTHRLAVATITFLLALPQTLWAQEAVEEHPSAGAMVSDLLIARPLGFLATVGGTAVFLVSLPFTLASGHVAEAADTLVVSPGEATFVRCLGCREPGYSHKDAELIRGEREFRNR